MSAAVKGRLQETGRGLRFVTRLIFRPFAGYWELKHEHRGNPLSATIILLLTVLTRIFNRQYCGYYFSTYDPKSFNIFTEIATVLVPFFLWVVANWCLTTLMDGEGSMKDIYVATAYALSPYVLIMVPLTIISNGLCMQEATYYYFFTGFALVWMGLLIFIGSMITHQYELLKSVVSCLLTILGMCIIVFIAMLFYNLIQHVIAFVMSSARELSFRFY